MTKDEIIKIGQEVLDIESRAIGSLIARLDDTFAQAVELLFQTKSRIIVTGMGKSGLIGRKIAATLASCGTPAIYIHPAEAGHGDLGMILKDDVIVAVSYSGETREIVDLLDFIKRYGVRLIIITGDKHSRIARYSDIVLDAAVEREAEPAGIVPTASTAAALALGDALAIALMKKKGFGEKDFALFHPKGHLGKKLLRVESLMHSGDSLPIVRDDAAMSAVIEVMTKKKLGMTCVVDEHDRLAGVITDGDLRRLLLKHGDKTLAKTAKECMTRNPKVISKDELASKALNLLESNKITALVVKSSEGKVEGIIHLHDLWRTEMV
jgi:arabinose-5-phosphate isomerase